MYLANESLMFYLIISKIYLETNRQYSQDDSPLCSSLLSILAPRFHYSIQNLPNRSMNYVAGIDIFAAVAVAEPAIVVAPTTYAGLREIAAAAVVVVAVDISPLQLARVVAFPFAVADEAAVAAAADCDDNAEHDAVALATALPQPQPPLACDPQRRQQLSSRLWAQIADCISYKVNVAPIAVVVLLSVSHEAELRRLLAIAVY